MATIKDLPSGILIEAEAFDDYGGWVLDSMFELEMGSPYLLAHGIGVPVADATTRIDVPDAKEYHVWVRAKDWVPGHHPGRFAVAINGQTLDPEFGANDKDWSWQSAGKVALPKGSTTLSLHDLTGFCGRCDAIFLGLDDSQPPNGADETALNWRRQLRGLPAEPVDAGSFDVIVFGGGVVGSTAALAAARLGDRVALIHSRPVLGGNASVEIGLRVRGLKGPFVEELITRHTDGDLMAKNLLDELPNASLFLEYTVYHATRVNGKIQSIDAREARTGVEKRFRAPVIIDCSGRALMGHFAGAETLYGQESKAEYGESLAPVHREESHHGNTVFFRTRMAEHPVPFPQVTWAMEVAKDYANLGGQLVRPSLDNGPGPAAASPDPSLSDLMKQPLTHFWEYGQWLDPYREGERIRDHLLRAIFGTFSNVKTLEPQEFANLTFDHLAFVAAQGEFRRYKGDHVLSETEVRAHASFPDNVCENGGAFCLHYPPDRDAKYDFRIKNWVYDERDFEDYNVPFRSLYSCNIDNLMMAGKHISVTHIAGANTKFMGNGAQHAIATAAAAHLCKKYNLSPHLIGKEHIDELRDIVKGISERNEFPGRNGGWRATSSKL